MYKLETFQLYFTDEDKITCEIVVVVELLKLLTASFIALIYLNLIIFLILFSSAE